MLFHLLESTASSFMLFLDLKNYILVLVLSTAPQTSWSSIKNTSGKLFFFYPVSQITVDPSPCQTLLRQIHILNSCWQVQVHFFSPPLSSHSPAADSLVFPLEVKLVIAGC